MKEHRQRLKLTRATIGDRDLLRIESLWNSRVSLSFDTVEVEELARELPKLFPEHFTSAPLETGETP